MLISVLIMTRNNDETKEFDLVHMYPNFIKVNFAFALSSRSM